MLLPFESLQGKLLLDSGKLVGSFFDRTVILLGRHDLSGAFGLVLNRPTGKSLGSIIRDPIGDVLMETPVFSGGPVQTELVSFLQETEPDPETDLLPGLMMTQSLDSLKNPYAVGSVASEVRAYVGYAGWSKGQLEEEIRTGCWIVQDAARSLVFHPNPQNLWKDILSAKGGIFQLMAHSPDNPALN